MRSWRRYSTARSVFHESKTARTAMSICSRGSCGNGEPERSSMIFLNVVDQALRSSTSSSTSFSTPLSSLRSSRASAKHARLDAEHGRPEHLQQPPVGVVGEPLAAVGHLRESVHGLVVEPDVEHRLHHPGHRELRTGPHRDQQRPVGLAELAAHLLLERLQVLADLLGQLFGSLPLLQVGPARLGADREPRRDRQAQVRHLGQVRALAAQQVALVLAALGEVVHVLGLGTDLDGVMPDHDPSRRSSPRATTGFVTHRPPSPRPTG